MIKAQKVVTAFCTLSEWINYTLRSCLWLFSQKWSGACEKGDRQLRTLEYFQRLWKPHTQNVQSTVLRLARGAISFTARFDGNELSLNGSPKHEQKRPFGKKLRVASFTKSEGKDASADYLFFSWRIIRVLNFTRSLGFTSKRIYPPVVWPIF